MLGPLRRFARLAIALLVVVPVACGGGASVGPSTPLPATTAGGSASAAPSAPVGSASPTGAGTPGGTLASAAPGATATPGAPLSSASPTGGATSSASPAAIATASPAATATASPSPSPSPNATATGGTATLASNPLCLPVTPAPTLASPLPLRFGVDVGAAGNLAPVSATTLPPTDPNAEAAALAGLHPAHGPLVIRLNRLFWSGGEPLLQQFAAEAQGYAQRGYDVEVQVRYHPDTTQVDDIAGWVAYVRHVVDVLGANPGLVALTITNEVNFDVSPNTSDGFYPGAEDALVQGVEAAADEAAQHGWGTRIRMGFTFAYRLNPATDVMLFQDIAQKGGPAFVAALGFVGLDDYPGTVYPPTFTNGATPGSEMSAAIATMRTCYLPMAGIPASVPLWLTENGYGSANGTTAQQASALKQMVDAVRSASGTYDVTDYRWFNLRDNLSTGSGTFDQDGLLRDDYTQKPSYATFASEIAVP